MPFQSLFDLEFGFDPDDVSVAGGISPLVPPPPVSRTNGSFDISFDENSFDVFRNPLP